MCGTCVVQCIGAFVTELYLKGVSFGVLEGEGVGICITGTETLFVTRWKKCEKAHLLPAEKNPSAHHGISSENKISYSAEACGQ